MSRESFYKVYKVSKRFKRFSEGFREALDVYKGFIEVYRRLTACVCFCRRSTKGLRVLNFFWRDCTGFANEGL